MKIAFAGVANETRCESQVSRRERSYAGIEWPYFGHIIAASRQWAQRAIYSPLGVCRGLHPLHPHPQWLTGSVFSVQCSSLHPPATVHAGKMQVNAAGPTPTHPSFHPTHLAFCMLLRKSRNSAKMHSAGLQCWLCSLRCCCGRSLAEIKEKASLTLAPSRQQDNWKVGCTFGCTV